MSTPDARLHKVWSNQGAHVDLRRGGFLLWHEALLHAPEVRRESLTCHTFLCLIAPFFVLVPPPVVDPASEPSSVAKAATSITKPATWISGYFGISLSTCPSCCWESWSTHPRSLQCRTLPPSKSYCHQDPENRKPHYRYYQKAKAYATLNPYLLACHSCSNVRGTAPRPLPQVWVDNREVEVGAPSPWFRVHLLDQPSELLQSGDHPGVDLQLVLWGLPWRNSIFKIW